MKIFKKFVEGDQVLTVRLDAIITNCEAARFYELAFDIERKRSWDPLVAELKLVHTFNEYENITYEKYKLPLFFSSRDFVNYRFLCSNTTEKGKQLMRENNLPFGQLDCFILLSTSAQWESIPPIKKVHRASRIREYWLIEDLPDNKGCLVKTVATGDLKGNLPTFFLNMVAAKVPRILVKDFLKAYSKIYFKQKSELKGMWADQKMKGVTNSNTNINAQQEGVTISMSATKETSVEEQQEEKEDYEAEVNEEVKDYIESHKQEIKDEVGEKAEQEIEAQIEKQDEAENNIASQNEKQSPESKKGQEVDLQEGNSENGTQIEKTEDQTQKEEVQAQDSHE